MKIQWMKPEDAHNSLRGELDESGAADGCIVRLDASHERHDGGPYLRQAWYDGATGGFVCSSTGTILPNVQAWAYDFYEEDEARAGLPEAQCPYRNDDGHVAQRCPNCSTPPEVACILQGYREAIELIERQNLLRCWGEFIVIKLNDRIKEIESSTESPPR